ncbi:hypothetical protein [Streptomyces sp. NPDC001250]|uniref:hypothetical protein n=1 Tax=unclassified Streptomyces TaxID=2593676 RepID=UPI00332717EA
MSDLAAVLFAAALGLILASLVAAAAGKIARREGASYPTAIRHAALAFAGSLTLAAAVAGALAAILS